MQRGCRDSVAGRWLRLCPHCPVSLASHRHLLPCVLLIPPTYSNWRLKLSPSRVSPFDRTSRSSLPPACGARKGRPSTQSPWGGVWLGVGGGLEGTQASSQPPLGSLLTQASKV